MPPANEAGHGLSSLGEGVAANEPTRADPSKQAGTRRLRDATPFFLAAAGFTAYTAWSLMRHQHFQTMGYDLGIFEQAVRGYSEGRPPIAELITPGYNLLGDHFHPILVVLAPLYLVFKGSQTLLIAQSFLIAASAIPVTRHATRTLGTIGGVLIGTSYLLAYGLLTAVSFDFHEICFAVPLLALSAEGLLAGDWNRAVLWAVPLALVKEDLPVTLAAVGLFLIIRRQRLLGTVTLLSGLIIAAALVWLVLPALNTSRHYPFADKLDFTALSDGLPAKMLTLLVLLGPTMLLAPGSPLFVLALPTLAWRFASPDTHYWQTGFHYDAVLVPIVFLSGLDALTHVRLSGRQWSFTSRLLPVCSLAMAMWSVVHLLPKVPQPLWSTSQIETADSTLAKIPDGSYVAASNRLAPHLTGRTETMLFPITDRTRPPDWIVVAKPFVPWPTPTAQQRHQLTHLSDNGYHVVVDRPTITLLQKNQPAR